MRRAGIGLAAVLALAVTTAVVTAQEGGGGPASLYETDFSDGHGDWAFTDPAVWELGEDDGATYLELLRDTREYEPPVRSPRNIAWLTEPVAGSFVMDVQARYTGREYGHADLCFFFGKQDASHFYYVHIATEADPHANSIFLVNGEPRVSIAEETTEGTNWTDGWHNIRIVRDIDSGLIEVFFDDMDTPIMRATDTTHGEGQVGLGSFDDAGQFTNFRLGFL